MGRLPSCGFKVDAVVAGGVIMVHSTVLYYGHRPRKLDHVMLDEYFNNHTYSKRHAVALSTVVLLRGSSNSSILDLYIKQLLYVLVCSSCFCVVR